MRNRIVSLCFTAFIFFMFVFSSGEIIFDLSGHNSRDSLPSAQKNLRTGLGGLKDSVCNLLNLGIDSAFEESGSRDFFIDLYGLVVREMGLRRLNNVPTDKIVRLENGHLCNVSEKSDLAGPTQAVLGFAQELRKRGIPFLFVLEPHKGHKTAPMLYPGLYDYSNKNADKMLAVFRQNQIQVLDTRKIFLNDPETHYGLFYKGDSHWNALYAFFVFLETAKELAQMGIQAPEANLELEHYSCTYSFSNPMNDLSKGFGKYYLPREPELQMNPTWKTLLSVRNVQTRETFEGAFEAPVFMRDLFELSVQNLAVPNRHKIFLVTDSMGRASVGFFALAYRQIEFRPLNQYEGFLIQEIEKFQPEIVLLMMTGRNYGMEYMLTKEKLLSFPERDNSH